MTEVWSSAGTASEHGVGAAYSWLSAAVHMPDLRSGTETSRAERHPRAIGETETPHTAAVSITEEHPVFKGFQDLPIIFCNVSLSDIMLHHIVMFKILGTHLWTKEFRNHLICCGVMYGVALIG